MRRAPRPIRRVPLVHGSGRGVQRQQAEREPQLHIASGVVGPGATPRKGRWAVRGPDEKAAEKTIAQSLGFGSVAPEVEQVVTRSVDIGRDPRVFFPVRCFEMPWNAQGGQ